MVLGVGKMLGHCVGVSLFVLQKYLGSVSFADSGVLVFEAFHKK